MIIDIRREAARYYDLNGGPDDLRFYRDRITSQETKVFELGCGTGRLLIPLAESCAFVHGVDLSDAMIAICMEKLERAKLPSSKVKVELGDITQLRLDQRFELVTAPFRVLQNLETDAEVDAFFETIRSHLAPGGTALITAFRPNRSKEELKRLWPDEQEYLCWEKQIDGDLITCHETKPRINEERMVLYPKLIFRQRRGSELLDEATLKLTMRCYYADEFEQLVRDRGFEIVNRWGGYAGEAYGEGPELILEFREMS